MRRLCEELHQTPTITTTIYCDKKSAIALTKNPVFHGRSKHIEIKFHYIRALVKEKDVAMEFCKSEDQVADILTKPLQAEPFYKLKHKLGLGVCSFDSLSLRKAVGD